MGHEKERYGKASLKNDGNNNSDEHEQNNDTEAD